MKQSRRQVTNRQQKAVKREGHWRQGTMRLICWVGNKEDGHSRVDPRVRTDRKIPGEIKAVDL